MNDSPPPLVREDAAERSLVEDVRQLVEDARTLAEAELAYQKSRASLAGSSIGRIAGLGTLALVLVYFALMALVFGLVLALVPYLTTWGATAAVVLGLLLAAALAAGAALARWKRLSALLKDGQ
jgi:uncharacterized membrane protein YqjE